MAAKKPSCLKGVDARCLHIFERRHERVFLDGGSNVAFEGDAILQSSGNYAGEQSDYVKVLLAAKIRVPRRR